VVLRYHLYPNGLWVCVPGGGDGLVQPVCAGLGAFDNAGDGICVTALQHALMSSKPEILNTDQGVQFTSAEFLDLLTAGGIRISMDGRGRVYDNIFVERLWRSVKYEEVYLREYREVKDARDGLARYFDFYNRERPHRALGIKRLTRSTSHSKGASVPLSRLLKLCTIYPPIFCLDNGEGFRVVPYALWSEASSNGGRYGKVAVVAQSGGDYTDP